MTITSQQPHHGPEEKQDLQGGGPHLSFFLLLRPVSSSYKVCAAHRSRTEHLCHQLRSAGGDAAILSLIPDLIRSRLSTKLVVCWDRLKWSVNSG